MARHDLCDNCDICDRSIETRRSLRIRPLTPSDMLAVSEMTARCSRDTIYHRFHGFINLPNYLGTLLAGEQKSVLAWWGSSCVGLASLGPGLRGQELAVLVEDAWQRQGVGGAMCEALVDLARGQGFALLHADVLFEDVFILGVLARYGRLQVELEYGDYSVAIHLDDGLLADAPVLMFGDARRSRPPSCRRGGGLRFHPHAVLNPDETQPNDTASTLPSPELPQPCEPVEMAGSCTAPDLALWGRRGQCR
jgi:GNAT superfamily N-acetyltransferase